MLAFLKWLMEHLVIRSKNLNDDPDAKPTTSIEIGIGGNF